MDGILIEPKDEAELKYIYDILDKNGIKHSLLDLEELEDLALFMMMEEVEKDKETVTQEEVLKFIRSNGS